MTTKMPALVMMLLLTCQCLVASVIFTKKWMRVTALGLAAAEILMIVLFIFA